MGFVGVEGLYCLGQKRGGGPLHAAGLSYDLLVTGRRSKSVVCAVSPCCRAATCPLFDQTDPRKANKAFEILSSHPRATVCTASLLLEVDSSP